MRLTRDFQRRLIDNIQPIRHFFLAQVLHHALDLRVFSALAEEPGIELKALADRLDLDPQRLLGLLLFLQNEGYVVDERGWLLTGRGSELPVFAPWYEMLVGGYAPTMQQLGDVLRPGAGWAARDTTRVGAGSCGIGVYDAAPVVQQLIGSAGREITTLIDLGCGDAGFLIDVLLEHPGLRGVGVEPNLESVERARTLRAGRGVCDRLDLFEGTAADVDKLELPALGRGACFMTAFVMQEMLEQEGETAVEEMLRNTFQAYPEARWLVVEMDYRPDAPLMAHGLALAFYNPYFLIHTVTEQRLESREWWNAMFARAGLTSMMSAYPDDRADTTGLQFGELLIRA
jgi:2-ketoarginine methyltransferase